MRFFFYGTLIAESGNPLTAAVHEKLHPLGPATARGRLFAVRDAGGWYPVLLPGAAPVHGMLYETASQFRSRDLARLDAYEDFAPSRPAESLYIRREISVVTADCTRGRAQAYCFDRPLPAAARRIAGGDFRTWLAAHGLDAYAGR